MNQVTPMDGVAVNEVSMNPYLHINAGLLIIDAAGTYGQKQAVVSTDNMLLTMTARCAFLLEAANQMPQPALRSAFMMRNMGIARSMTGLMAVMHAASSLSAKIM